LGHAAERGEGEGLGYNLNLPLPRGTTDADYLNVLQTALTRMRAFGTDVIVLALGLDAHENDPFQGFKITTGGFARIAEAIAGISLPTVIVQEGGYLFDDLGANLTSPPSRCAKAPLKNCRQKRRPRSCDGQNTIRCYLLATAGAVSGRSRKKPALFTIIKTNGSFCVAVPLPSATARTLAPSQSFN